MAGLMFGTYFLNIEKTFAHRDQVVGEIERKDES